MRLRIRKKGNTVQTRAPAPQGRQADFSYPPGGAHDAGADGLPGTAGYRGGPKNKPPGGFVFAPPRPEALKRTKKPWE